MIYVELPQQSNAADWEETIQLLSEDDGLPLWTTPPVDLVGTLTVIPEGTMLRSDYGSITVNNPAAVITALTTDATGKFKAYDNGFLQILIDDSVMATLGPDNYNIAKRYLVFIKVQTAGRTDQLLIAVLPVYRGA
jgi:hypothetical protein